LGLFFSTYRKLFVIIANPSYSWKAFKIDVKYLSLFFLVIFVLFAIVQLNDPDPYIWMPIYLASAYTSFCGYKLYYNPMLLTIFCIAYLIGALSLFPDSFSTRVHMGALAKSMEMKMPFIEEARESLGLAICFFVNLIYLFVGMKRAKLPGYNLELFQRQENKSV
jgi:hypothetical protein